MNEKGPVRERSQPSARTELTVALWLTAVLLGEFLAIVWFFGRLGSS
jgi:hypothetical protein